MIISFSIFGVLKSILPNGEDFEGVLERVFFFWVLIGVLERVEPLKNGSMEVGYGLSNQQSSEILTAHMEKDYPNCLFN